MNTNKPVWKKFLLIAAVAFILGLLPYFVLLFQYGVSGVPLTLYLKELVVWIWQMGVKYAPHIISLYILGVAVLIFFEGQNPDRTILWLLTLALLPVVGLILYLILGPDFKRMQRRKLFRPSRSFPSMTSPLAKKTPVRVRKIATLAYRNCTSDILEHNEVCTLIDGQETFSAIKAELHCAQRYINIEYFIYKDDRIGQEIADILCEKASSGVKVRMVVDAVGSWRLGGKLAKRLQRAGVQFRTFLPVSFPVFHSTVNFRNHRKIIVVDGVTALTGGLNVGVEYLGEGKLGNWRDTHVLFRGEAVHALNEVFLHDWEIASGETLSPDAAEFAPPNPLEYDAMPFLPMQIVSSGSSSAWHAIAQMYFMMIAEAQTRIWITSPYLVPGPGIYEALQTAALCGVDVRILIPDKSDHFLVYWAGRSNIEELLRAGVRIWKYKNGFIHSKTMVMDDAIVSVGTANLDARSLEINFEVQAFIYDSAVCESYAKQFLADLEDSEECLLAQWSERGICARGLESLGRLWSSQI